MLGANSGIDLHDGEITSKLNSFEIKCVHVGYTRSSYIFFLLSRYRWRWTQMIDKCFIRVSYSKRRTAFAAKHEDDR